MGPGEDEAPRAEELSDEEVSPDWTPQEKALHEAKMKAKAKRRLRRTSSRDSTRESESADNTVEPVSPRGKVNDRKSRMGKGRGLPKKGERTGGW